ncbi:MAG: hypothetical protein ICV60_12385 [Pyrinomonadaceae bacterium]|nr:hypothetical protein [Pyrinomonadaceae bacterium]
MKDDYLWDKSGEPDPEIAHLERVLGNLRSKRTAQDLMPAFEKSLPRKGARVFTRMLAVAAALAFALLVAGAFAVLQRQAKKPRAESSPLVMVNPVTPEPTVESDAAAKEADEVKPEESAPLVTVGVPNVKPRRSSLESRSRSINRRREAITREREQAEGLMAKEQLMRALEITSTNLSFVQKKVRGDVKLGPSS